ncbi:MAG: glycosyltransferase family 39 protein [Patescibacteria group bacterium]|nr:glycosyltransferase family 39 protein [Patescibacteria group bacterium]
MVKKIIIILISLATIFIRFYHLGSVPPHLGNDEISIAYDAYSIGQTLRDEHNHFLPISFASHGTYKAPLYIYFSVLPIKFFGNTEFAARFISAIAGILTIILLGFLTYKISGNQALSLLSSAILAFSPWHIYTSRIALESNLAFFFFLSGIYLFLFAKEKERPWFFLLGSSLSFSLSIYSYHTEWLLSPLFIFFLPFFFKLKTKFAQAFYWFITVLLCLPIFSDYLNNLGTTARANTEMIWKHPYVYHFLQNSSHTIIEKFSILLATFFSNYSGNINPGFLFFNGLNLLPQKTPYQFGLLLAISLPFLVIGLWSAKKFFGQYFQFLIFFTAIGPFVASLTNGGPNLVRNLPTLAPYSILIAAGLISIWGKVKTYQKYLIIFAHLLCLFYFLAFYFVHYPVYSAEGWQYGYKQVALLIKPLYPKYDKIIIDPRFGKGNVYAGVPHLYLPYFTNLDPKILLSRGGTDALIFGKYKIKNLDWEIEKNIEKNTLYVLPEDNPPPKDLKMFHLLYTVNLPSGQPEFRIYETISP